MPVCKAGTVDGKRSASRTGRSPIPSPTSIDGIAAGNCWVPDRLFDPEVACIECLASWLLW